MAIDGRSWTGSTYPAGAQWRYSGVRHNVERTESLVLLWEVSLDPISDDFTPDEIDADALFGRWVRDVRERDGWSRRLGEPWVNIYWSVTTPEVVGTFERAPLQDDELAEQFPDIEDFLTFFTWPEHAETGEDVNWLRLPVLDKLWDAEHSDKGGFIQSATGWKPSAYQPVMSVEVLTSASRR